MLTVEALRRILGLVPLPVEGGYFASLTGAPSASPPGASVPPPRGPRRPPVEMLHLHPDGSHQIIVIGPAIPGGRYALLGTTVAPGFDY